MSEPDRVRVSLSELARLKGVTPQAISKRLRRFEREGLLRSIEVEGREKTILLAEWDAVTNEHSDLRKLAGAATAKGVPLEEIPIADPAAKRDPTYTQELTRKARYDADLREIELMRLRGELLDAADVVSASEVCAEAVVQTLERLPSYADDFASAVTKEGAPGLRSALKHWVRQARVEIGQAFKAISSTVTEHETETVEVAADA